MYTHVLTSASWKQGHNMPLTAGRSGIDSSSLQFWGCGGGGGVQGEEGVHIHRRSKMEGGEVACGCKDFYLFWGSDCLQKNKTKPAISLNHPPNTDKV